MTPVELTSMRSKRAAAALALAWGYPRSILLYEIEAGRWWSTPDGVAWMVEGLDAGDVQMHGIGRPGARRVISPDLTRMVLEAAHVMGARRVVQPLVGKEYAALRRLWVRAGWKLDEFGQPFMEVGDGH